MKVRYGIEDISQQELDNIKNQVVSNCGFIYVEDIKFFIKDKLPLKNDTLNNIMIKIFGEENIKRACWGDGSKYEFFEVQNIATITPLEFASKMKFTSKWSRKRKK